MRVLSIFGLNFTLGFQRTFLSLWRNGPIDGELSAVTLTFTTDDCADELRGSVG